jgi:predicted alpha/beta superfamily hydrolase
MVSFQKLLRHAGLWLALVCTSAWSASAPTTAYQIPNTVVHELPSKTSQRSYQVWVDLPASYATSDKKYPVVFVTDPQYAFTLVHGIRHLLGRSGQNIEDFILVGLAHAQGEDAFTSRSRDYTPTNPLKNPKRDPDTYGASEYGGAAAYRDYVESEVFRLIATQYRADMGRKVLIGHSYGALFGAYTLLTKPQMFQSYILGSPSLWFDQRVIQTLEQQYAQDHKDLNARVMLFAGGFETIRPGPRYYKKTDLVKDTRQFEATLKRRHYPSLQIGSQIVEGEDHFTVYPTLVGRGLLWALPGFGPYISG